MKTFRIRIGLDAVLSAPVTPVRHAVNAAGLPRRRLDDRVMEIYGRAVAHNRLDEAAELLTILEKWHQRRKARYGRDRRTESELKAMRGTLERLTALRTS